MAQEAGLTPAFNGSELTVAVISDVLPAWTSVTDAVRETEIAARVMLTGPEINGSTTAVAVIFTVTLLEGGVAGAL